MSQLNENNTVSTVIPQPITQIPNAGQILPPGAGFVPMGPGIPFPPNANIASLYVGELKPEVTEQLLWNIFSPYGQVLSVKVCRDSQTQMSLGYAYVNFRSTVEAEKAMEAVNFTNIDGRPCRVMWSMRDATRRKFGIGNLFIKNIDQNLDAKSLYQAFSAFGPVLSCKIALDEYGLSKGYGFIQFYNEGDAEKARERSNGVSFSNKKLVVTKFIPKAERKDAKPFNPDEFTNVFCKNFGKDWTDAEFKKAFEKFGEITSMIIPKNEKSESSGFGFVNYAKHEFAAAAVRELNETAIENGNKITVCRAMKRLERQAYLRRQYEDRKRETYKKYQNLNLYIKNFDENVTDAKLREMFEEFGEIKSAHIMKDENNRTRCFGFVCFSKPEEAQKAIEVMHLKVFEGRPLYVAHAQSKEERRKVFEQNAYNNSFRGPMMAPPGSVQYVYPAPGSFPYAPPQQFARFSHQQPPNRNHQRNMQQGGNQSGQQYSQQNVQRNYNNYQQNSGYQGGGYRPRNNSGGRMGGNNQGSYQSRQHQNQQSSTVVVNHVVTENASRPRQHDVKNVQQQKAPQPDPRSEFDDRVYNIGRDAFNQNNLDSSRLLRVSGIVIDYFRSNTSAVVNIKDQDIQEALLNAYQSVVNEEMGKN